MKRSNVLGLVKAESSSRLLSYEISRNAINWLDGHSIIMTVNNNQLLECWVLGIDPPALSSGLECYSDQSNRNSWKKHEKLNFRYFPDIDTYKYAKNKTRATNHVKMLPKQNGLGWRRITKVLLDEQDYAFLVLSQGLSFLYHAFETNHEYVNHSYRAQTEELHLLRLSKRFVKLLWSWDVRSPQITNISKHIQSSTASRYRTLKKTCVKQCKNIPYCCIDVLKPRFDGLVLKQ